MVEKLNEQSYKSVHFDVLNDFIGTGVKCSEIDDLIAEIALDFKVNPAKYKVENDTLVYNNDENNKKKR